MANPHLKDGHTDIAHEIVEALCRINLSAYESRILWALYRKTYGWHKKYDRISYSQWEEITNLKRGHIARTIKQLVARNIVTRRGNGYKLEYGFQKDYEKWDSNVKGRAHSLPVGGTNCQSLSEEEIEQSLPLGGTNNSLPLKDKLLPVGDEPFPKGGTKSLPRGGNTKEKKETRQKKLDKRKDYDSSNYPIKDFTDLTEAMAEIATLYEAEIGKITSFVAAELNDMITVYPADWIKDAIKESVRQNKRKLSYVLGILRHWKEEGRQGKPGTGASADPDKYVKGKYGHMVGR